MPDETGSVTPRAGAAATAASAALPPARSTSMPALVASRSTVDTAPPEPTATACLPPTRVGAIVAACAPAGAAVAIAAARTAVVARLRRIGMTAPGWRSGRGCSVEHRSPQTGRYATARHGRVDG